MAATVKYGLKATSFIALLFPFTSSATTFEWYFQNQKLTLNYNFNPNDYSYYKSKSKFGQNMALYAEQEKGHSYLASFAEELRITARQHQWFASAERDMVIRFVQQAIPYKTDPYNYGYDYPRYPIETLHEKNGDCEDKACLLTALLKTLGHDAVLLEFADHMAAGVAGNDIEGSVYELNGKKYYYTETTGTFEPGNNPGYKTALVKTVKQTAYAVKNPLPATNNIAYKPAPKITKSQTLNPDYIAQKNNTDKVLITYATRQVYVVKRIKKNTKMHGRITYLVIR